LFWEPWKGREECEKKGMWEVGEKNEAEMGG